MPESRDISYVLGLLSFRWNQEKARTNYQKHGITFQEACTVFQDELALLQADATHSSLEQRYALLGYSSHRRMLLVVHTERGTTLRIISARQATPKERREYENG